MKTAKKSLALFLLFTMLVASLGACKGKSSTTDGTDGTTSDTTSDASTTGTENNSGNSSADNFGTGEATYTYNSYTTSSAVKTLNIHEWEMSDEYAIMSLTQPGLYNVIYSDTERYTFCCDMASDFPTDVTAEYAGDGIYCVPEGATQGYAFKIPLRQEAQWEDGTPLTADDYIYSMQQMLNPDMANYRATLWYEGTYSLANAYAYYCGGADQYISYYDSGSGEYAEVQPDNLYFSATEATEMLGMSLEDAAAGDYAGYFTAEDGTDTLAVLKELQGQEKWILVDDTVRAAIDAMIAAFDANYGMDVYDEQWLEVCTYKLEMEATSWDQVGLIKNDDNTITMIFTQPILGEFDLYSGLASGWLVKEDIYEANKSETGGLIKTTYGTAVDKYASYGPYKLTQWQADKVITLEKNDKWFGYTDESFAGQYQATKVEYQIIDEHATALQLFLQGKLDEVGLETNDLQTYGTSDYAVYTPETYTFKLSFNTDRDSLTSRQTPGVNKTIILYKDFRKAFSLAVNRTEYCQAVCPNNSAAYGLLNELYIYETKDFSYYRDTDYAKQVLCDVYDADSYEALSGYNMNEASQLLESAYQEALAAGDIQEGDKVVIEYNVSNTNDSTQKSVNFVADAIVAAAVGTSLEGRISIELKQVDDYYASMGMGSADLILSAWGGDLTNPYALMQCYVDPAYTYDGEYGYDGTALNLTMTVDGQEYTYSYYEWYKELCEGQFVDKEDSIRLQVLAGLEGAVLEEYCGIPIYSRRQASLLSQKVQYITDVFEVLIDPYGGLRFMKFLYTDEEWDAYCSEQNNQLSY